MKSRILAFAGKAQSGKNTLSNFLHGCQMQAYSTIDGFTIDTDGNLIIEQKNANGEKEFGRLDVTRSDFEFGEWACKNMWPLVKNYSFATELKELGINLFNIPREYVYGTDIQKNKKIPHLYWENMPGVIIDEGLYQDAISNAHGAGIKEAFEGLYFHKSGSMTGREWLQFFGTEICRKMYGSIWTDRTLKNIENEQPQLAIISDCRFENECIAIKEAGGFIIKLNRNEDVETSHISENGFGSFTDFDAIINNKNMPISQTTEELLTILRSWGWGEE
jgi:hypothetical protein